jgi:CRISPR-associated endonuclease Csn1
MKKILGLDIGTTSIGWAIVEAADEKKINDKTGETAASDINNDRIGIHLNGKHAVGVRIIKQDDERFKRGQTLNDPKGTTLTPTATRRKYRGARRMKSRYKLRRDKLLTVLSTIGMMPEGQFAYAISTKKSKGKWVTDDASEGKLYTKIKRFNWDDKGNKKRIKRSIDIGEELYELRNKALTEKIDLQEWGRILLHLNQWRGYSSDRFKKDDKPTYDYYTGQVIDLSEQPIHVDYEDKEKKIVKWFHYSLSIKLDEPIAADENTTLDEITGVMFVKDQKQITFKKGDIISFKYEVKENKEKAKKIVSTYYKINITQPDPEDWNYRYQKLNKTLNEWCDAGGTVGSFFYHNFYEQKNIDRIRNNVVNRNYYEDEFEKIWAVQYPLHKEVLENHSIEQILNLTFKDEGIRKQIKSISTETEKDTFEKQLKHLIKDKIIYYQRPWQQSKSKGGCRFEKVKVIKERINKKTKQPEKYEDYEGRAVIPRSHPLHQEFKIWQQINNVKLWGYENGLKTELFATPEKFLEAIGKTVSEVKQLLYDELQQKKSQSWRTFVKEKLGLNLRESNTQNYYEVNFIKKNKKGEWQDNPLKGNTTKVQLKNILPDYTSEWFAMPHVHPEDNSKRKCKAKTSNLQLLWEIIYDITNNTEDSVANIIKTHFGFEPLICKALSKVKLDDTGMGSLSAKAIRQLLPLMQDGDDLNENRFPEKIKQKIASLIQLNNSEEENQKPDSEKLLSLQEFITDKNARKYLSRLSNLNNFKGLNYWEAAAIAYGQHSRQGIHSSQINKDDIDKLIEPVKRGSMNNPVVEKIVNETLSLVKDIYKHYDGFDEIRIELSRELKASREEREHMWEGMLNSQKRNEWAKAMLRDMNEALSGNNIDKLKIYEDISQRRYEADFKKQKFDFKEPTKSEIERYKHWLDQKCQCPYTGEIISLTDIFGSGLYDVDHIIPRERYFDNAYSNKVICRKVVNKDMKGNLLPYEMLNKKRPSDDRVKDAHGNYIKKNGEYLRLLDWEDFEEHVKKIFPKGRKLANLLRKEIPEDDPIARQLKETQYINKKLKEVLSKVVGTDKVWTTTGAVTDVLRSSWHLDDEMKELLRERFENFKFSTKKKKQKDTEEVNENLSEETDEQQVVESEEKSSDFKIINLVIPNVDEETGEITSETFLLRTGKSVKRLDHRHHALDALIIACTKQTHIQLINNLNAASSADMDDNKKRKYQQMKADVCIGNSSKKFKTPWKEDAFIPAVRKALQNIIVSQKNTNILISPSKHRSGKDIKPQKIASPRGRLHKETNYAKRNYYTPGNKILIAKVIENILRQKEENQNQTMVFPKSFEEIIKQTVFKEKYQKALLPFFMEYEKESLNKGNRKIFQQTILQKIKTENEPLKNIEWLMVFSEKNSAARPNGLTINLNESKLLDSKTGIANPRIKRLVDLRQQYIKQKQEVIKADSSIEKEEKDKQIKQLAFIPLYSNGIYEVRIINNGNPEWIYLPEITSNQIEQIVYPKPERTQKVKEAVKARVAQHSGNASKAFSNIFENPVFVDDKRIPVKKARQFRWMSDLYEIHPGNYVYSSDTFMLYMFEKSGENKKIREWRFLKFLDAIRLLDAEKPDKISYKDLLTHENSAEYPLIFTLQQNDLIYLPDKDEDINAIDFNDVVSISQKLYNIKDLNPSRDEVKIQKNAVADSIELAKTDVQQAFPTVNAKDLSEEIKFGTIDVLNRCIKVFTNKLGNKIVPYWKLPHGCWDRETAQKLQLT